MRISLILKACPAAALILMTVGCSTPTTILSSQNPSGAPAASWADYDSLPVFFRGSVPGVDLAALSASFPRIRDNRSRRMVIYLNPAYDRPPAALCGDSEVFTAGVQTGVSARVTAALCDGPVVISTAEALIHSADEGTSGFARNLFTVRSETFQALQPRWQDPGRYFEGSP
jgi:hypothetical protein